MTVTITRASIPDFACSDERVNRQGWEFALVGCVHRDCQTIDHSNAQVIQERLASVDPEQEHWGTLSASHWAVGWYDHLIVDSTHEGVMKVLRDAKRAIDCYPVLSEDHLSELEEEFHAEGRCDSHCPLCEEV